jgi:hypothetical protein
MAQFVIATPQYIVNVDLITHIFKTEDGGLTLFLSGTEFNHGGSMTVHIDSQYVPDFLNNIHVSGDK